jgi:hypothetical protein
MAKSKVLKAEPNGSWEGQYGVLYKYTILFDNGDQGEYSSKSDEQNKFVVGEEVEYERIDKGKYIHIKPISNFTPNTNYAPKKDGNVQEYIIKQSSLKCAVDICIAQGTYSTEDVIARADIFVDWVMNTQDVNKNSSGTNNDVPF